MQFSVDFPTVLLILGSIQGYYLSALLYFKHRNPFANRFLAFLILVYTIFVTGAVFSNLQIYDKFPHLRVLIGALPLIFGPLHYLYAKYLIAPNLNFKKIQWLHFLPFATYKLYTIPAYFMSSETLIEYVKIMQNYQEISVFTIVNWFLVLQGITYMILTIRLVQKYSLRMRDTFSSLEKINLRWLRNITILATIVWFIVFIEILYQTIYTEKPLEFNLIGIATSIYIYTLGYIGLFKSEIFSQKYVRHSLSHMMDTRENLLPESGTATLKSEREFDKTKGKKYTKSGLSDDKAKEYLARLQSLMEKEKPYLNNNLTLHQLAEELSISPHNLSEIINKFLNKNFFDYVNYFRIEEVKQKLQDPNKQILTLLSIAYDAGFNSKSGFNAIFKRSMKLTPSEYREKISKA